ncbi:MAG: SWIM zinc finger family protein [Chthoniobacterales bacterium]
MMTLVDWDFKDAAANSTGPQVNRQKSARNFAVKQMDRLTGQAVLFDAKRNQTHTATLTSCDCVDFSRQKNVCKPCMHIYRLAAELGLIQLEHMDHALANRLDLEAAAFETARLQHLPAEPMQWGRWSAEVHESFVQKNRQWRGYEDVFRHKVVEHLGGRCFVNRWPVSLDRCGCPDFDERRLPCKHMYALAISSDILLPLTYSEYAAANKRDEEMFFHHWGAASTKRRPLVLPG